jgi:hypothetical protein
MRSSDPAAYDQFIELTTASSPYTLPFRALYLTNTTAGTAAVCQVDIKQVNGTGSLGAAKTIYISTGVGAPSYLLPISGEYVSVTSVTGKIYALI